MRGYSIGDVSRALGLTPGALHFYEREGIIQAPKEKEGGRRFYTQSDLIRLLSCRKYRAMDISLKTIAVQFSVNGDPLDVIRARLDERSGEARRKAAYYQTLSEEIEKFVQEIGRLEAETGRFFVRSSPEVYVLKLSDGLLSPDKGEQALAQRWLEAMPATRIALLLSEDAQQAEYCYAIERERAHILGNIKEEKLGKAGEIYRLPEMMCVQAVVCDERMQEEPMCAFTPVLDYMRAHGLTPTGPAWGRLIVVDCSKGTLKTYAQVWVPFV